MNEFHKTQKSVFNCTKFKVESWDLRFGILIHKNNN